MTGSDEKKNSTDQYSVNLLLGQELVGEFVAGGAGVVLLDAVGDFDGEVKDGVVV